MFDVNESGSIRLVSIGCGGASGSKTVMSYIIKDEDVVALKIDEEDVYVKNIVQAGEGEYTGIIYGFGPGYNVTFKGLNLEQQVKFKKDNVFGIEKG